MIILLNNCCTKFNKALNEHSVFLRLFTKSVMVVKFESFYIANFWLIFMGPNWAAQSLLQKIFLKFKSLKTALFTTFGGFCKSASLQIRFFIISRVRHLTTFLITYSEVISTGSSVTQGRLHQCISILRMSHFAAIWLQTTRYCYNNSSVTFRILMIKNYITKTVITTKIKEVYKKTYNLERVLSVLSRAMGQVDFRQIP